MGSKEKRVEIPDELSSLKSKIDNILKDANSEEEKKIALNIRQQLENYWKIYKREKREGEDLDPRTLSTLNRIVRLVRELVVEYGEISGKAE